MKSPARLTIRQADASHARRLHALISANREEGRLLPRGPDEIAAHAERFVIACRGRRIVGCAELAPLSPQVAEVRSLVVDPSARGIGAGSKIIKELERRGRIKGFDLLCAFTHAPAFFSQMGFSIEAHASLPEKISTDCVKCPEFRRCGQVAMVLPLELAVETTKSDRIYMARH
jgi:amino-acid N-acetyltransferase